MSWHAWLLLARPDRVAAQLRRIEDARIVAVTPNLWQVELGVLRMWHRTFFRSDTIGTCTDHPVRNTRRARWMRRRPLRFPFLVREKAIAPWDMSGLAQTSDQLISHLLGAHHDNTQFVYDLQILRTHPGSLHALQFRLDAILSDTDPRGDWLQDLCVFEGYHQTLSDGLSLILAGSDELNADDANDPDISFYAYLRWCAAQPETPVATLRAWRSGTYHPQHGIERAA